jgi:predicted transcriptional regulator
MVDTALKQQVLSTLDRLPSTATLDDVIEQLVFLAKIDRGLADAQAGRLVSHADVAAEFLKK